MEGLKQVARAFVSAARGLMHGKPAIPLLFYFTIKLCIIVMYAATQFVPPPWLLKTLAGGIAAERFSHYPDRMILMPLVLGRIEIPLEVLLLSFVHGMIIFVLISARRNETISLRRAYSNASPLWLHLVVAYLVSSALLFAIIHIPSAIARSNPDEPYSMQFLIASICGLIAQSFLAYAGPFVVLEKRSGLDSVRRSIIFARHHFWESLILVTIPFVISLPMLLLAVNPLAIATQLSPDFLVAWQIAKEAVDLAMGYFLVGAAAIFFIESRGKERRS